MRAIIINAKDRTITETEIDGSLEALQQIVGGLIGAGDPGSRRPPSLLRE